MLRNKIDKFDANHSCPYSAINKEENSSSIVVRANARYSYKKNVKK